MKVGLGWTLFRESPIINSKPPAALGATGALPFPSLATWREITESGGLNAGPGPARIRVQPQGSHIASLVFNGFADFPTIFSSESVFFSK